MTDQDQPVPKDPPVPVETPESRMTGEGSPPPPPEEGEAADQSSEPAHEPEPHEPPD
ncbi:hypothetical protein ACFWP2_38645 [Kitasatospora sp. NPDC058444]|uniref:hypothetical protein n=1 Tax=Kitasatospora sp. NPDC058444 TaxID=3346504 RepID=UPI003663AB7D